MAKQYWQRSVYLLFPDAAFTDVKLHFSQEKRSHYECYNLIPKVVAEHNDNMINKLSQYLTQKQDHVMPLCDSLIIVLPDLTWRLASSWYRSSHPEVFIEKGVLKICSKFTEEHQCQNAISIKLQSNFIEILFRHGCSPVNSLHIFRTPFLKNTSRRLLLMVNTMMENKKGFTNIVISFLRSWSHKPCSATRISEKGSKYKLKLLLFFLSYYLTW